DGKPFTSRDVKFTWELVTSPKFGAFTKVGFDAVASMETPDESTVRVRLKEPFAPFLTAWGDAWIVPAHLLESVPDPNTAEFNTEAKGLPGVTLHLHHSPSVEYIYFNYGKPWFKERPVRQALYHATDKRAIIEQVYYGVPKPVEGYLPSTSWAYNADLPKHEYNPEKAKQILDEAGWRPGPDGIRVKGGVRLGFTNSTTSGNKLREQAQALLQQNWRAVGVDMQISNMPAAVIWGEFYVKSKFDSLMVGIQASVGDDPDCLNRIHSKYIAAETGSGRNVSQYKNPQVDRLLEDGVREVDRARRRAIYLKVQEVLRADLAYLPIFSYVRIEGVKEGLLNYKPNSNVLHNTWNMYEWGWKA